MGKFRLPAAQSFMSRDGTMGVIDSFVENGCINNQGEKLYVLKRPGTSLHTDFGVGADPQGATFYNNLIYGVYADTLYRTGGVINVGTFGDTWTQTATPSWYGRAFFTANVFQDRIYLIGGEAAVVRADIPYSDDAVTWSQSASGAPFGHRQGHQACVFNGQLWMMGGTGPTAVAFNDVWATSDGANWTQVTAAAAWTARLNFTLVAANNGMYIYGGELIDGTLADDVWFSTDGITWTELTTAATGTPRQLQSMLFFNNNLWIWGGYSDVAGTTPIDEAASSPDGQTWTVTAPVFAAYGGGRAMMAATVYRNQMWLVGGVNGSNTLVSEVLLSFDGVNWSRQTISPGWTPRAACQLVVFKTPTTINALRYPTMWLLGGNDGATDLQEVWYGNMDFPLASSYALTPTTSNQPYQFNSFLNATLLLIKNQSNFWVLQSGELAKVTDTNYPTQTVPGLVVLNSFAYVMQPDGTIRSCAIDDPYHWPSLQFIIADYEDDPGVAIAKYLNYLVAFGQYTLQFYYDAGNPAPGIALAPYQSASQKIGLTFASTLQSAKNTLIWVGQTKERNPGVYIFDGLAAKRISTKWVDGVINNNINSLVKSWVTAMEGHTFYVINFLSQPSLAYDMDTGEWSVWTSNVTGDGSVPYDIAVTEFFVGGDIWFGRLDFAGQIFIASMEQYDDNGTAFNFRIQTDKVDGNNLQRKFFGQADLVADINLATSTLDVSDDDYQSWNTWGTFNEFRMRPMLNRGGSGRRRAFRLTRTDANPARWEALEITASEGES